MFAVGFATEEEITGLTSHDFEVEDATKFGKVVGKEDGSLMLPPEPSPSNTRAVAIFLEVSIYELFMERLYGDRALPMSDEDKERHPAPTELQRWPELPFDEEFLRIVLLQSRILGKDTTVEPFTSYRDELEWRRTDKHIMMRGVGARLSVEQISERQNTLEVLQRIFTDQQRLAPRQLREICSHRYSDGRNITAGVPVSGQRWCNTCSSLFEEL